MKSGIRITLFLRIMLIDKFIFYIFHEDINISFNFMSTVEAQYWLIRNINVKMYRKSTIENVTSLSIVRISVVAFY